MSILQSVVINEQVRLPADADFFLAHGDALHAVITGQEKDWLIGAGEAGVGTAAKANANGLPPRLF